MGLSEGHQAFLVSGLVVTGIAATLGPMRKALLGRSVNAYRTAESRALAGPRPGGGTRPYLCGPL